jgi:LPS-assembly lipoprotein
MTLVALALNACGFHPLHGKEGVRSATVPEMAAIKIDIIADRSGQLVRNELLDNLTPKGQPTKPLYLLRVTQNETRQSLGILKDETASRANYTLATSFSLMDFKTGRLLYSGTASSQASFNILDEHYASTASEKNARDRTASEVADSITTQIAAYFSRTRATQAPAK